MKNLKGLFILLITSPAWAMGRMPGDPATWGDVTNVQNQVTANQAQEQADNRAVNDRIDTMNETKILLEGAVRLYDGKRIALEAFNQFDAAHGQNFAAGAKITLKLGSSYEEKLIKKQQVLIDQLMKQVGGQK